MRLSVLVFLRNSQESFLLLERKKAPNQGLWSPIGGKVEMSMGESPIECAQREVLEETGLDVSREDLHLFAMVTEKNYEHAGHWLLFLFDCRKKIDCIPNTFEEGRFAFYSREDIEHLAIAQSDREVLWNLYDHYRHTFSSWKLTWDDSHDLRVIQESVIGGLK